MDGLEWEIKCPTGRSRRTIENNIVAAEKQSSFIIINLRHINLPEQYCIAQIDKLFKHKPRIKRILVITKELQLLEYPNEK